MTSQTTDDRHVVQESPAAHEVDASNQDLDSVAPQDGEEGEEEEREEATEEGISQGVVFDILKNERRRLVLEHLDEQDGSVTLGELAERLAAVENEKPEAQVTSKERKRLYVGLYQCHLPRMDDADAIDFDSNRGSIETTAHSENFIEYLPKNRTDEDTGSPWPRYYLAIAAAGALLLTGSLVGVFPALLSNLAFGAVVLSLTACALLHYADTEGITDVLEN